MKLIVGLGNPGKEYVGTRHNTGFKYIDNYAKHINAKFDKNKFDGLYVIVKKKNEDLMLLKPQKYMNLSGDVIRKFVDYYKIDINNILVIHDDLDLPVGTYRLRKQGRSAGHNGLKNIELNLGTLEYKRLKIGISNNVMVDTKDYVLSKFNEEHNIKMESIEIVINNIIDDFIEMDFESLMAKYN